MVYVALQVLLCPVNPGKVQYLLNNWKDIRKVYRHNEMSISEMVKLPKIAILGKLIGMNQQPQKISPIKFKVVFQKVC